MILQGYLAILEKEEQPVTRDILAKILAAAGQISSMIQFTGEYEEIGASAPVWQDLRTLVDTAAGQIHPGPVTVENHVPDGLSVYADPLIRKVFANIMENAVRHGGDVPVIRFSARSSDGGMSVVCEDDGAGIPADEKKKIFERGYGRNTGMGLFFSREILGITGITIVENGEPGNGARLEIFIPKEMIRTAS
jgi:signal transduction histidine kinase